MACVEACIGRRLFDSALECFTLNIDELVEKLEAAEVLFEFLHQIAVYTWSARDLQENIGQLPIGLWIFE